MIALIIILFITQLISFYMITFLYMKMNRLKDNETRQVLLKEEMEETLAMYLAEMEDENNRLIDELKAAKQETITSSVTPTKKQPTMKDVKQAQEQQVIAQPIKHKQEQATPKFSTPTAIAKNAYKQQLEKPKTVNEQVEELFKKGLAIDEIAKKLNKGKTEVALMLKFKQ